MSHCSRYRCEIDWPHNGCGISSISSRACGAYYWGPYYWEYDWRKEHRGPGRYPEHELWEAVEGYLDILDASRPPSPGTPSSVS